MCQKAIKLKVINVMKILSLILKTIGIILIVVAAISFGSYFLPTEGVSLPGIESVNGSHMYYKIMPTNGASPAKVGFLFLLLGASIFLLPRLINKFMIKHSAT